MSDLTEQLSSILSDPEGMERIRSMAANLLSKNTEPPPLPTSTDTGDLPDLSKLMGIANTLKNQGDDDRIRLLYALKPHLSSEKQSRVDKAVKMLKLLSLAPLLKNMGILEF